MKIELKRGSEDYAQTLHLEGDPQVMEIEAEGAAFEKPIEVGLSVAKSQDQIICRGTVETSVRLECSRCLTQYHQNLVSDLDFVVDLSGGSEAAKSEEEGYYLADPSSSFFEIDDLVREVIILSLPLKPLCSQACRGLCPVCGTDLNKSQCHCVREKTDPRWDQLKGLMKKKS
jgi:uncharacterized protein